MFLAMRKKPAVFYAAIDVDYPGTHGGSSHVGEAVHSLKKFCSRVYLLCKWCSKQSFLEKRDNLTIIRLPILNVQGIRVLSYFMYSFCTALFLCLTKEIDIIYERGRIVGGGAMLIGLITGKKTCYEINEPLLEVPLVVGKLQADSIIYKIIKTWHTYMVAHASLIVATHKSSLENLPHNQALILHYGTNPQKFNPNVNAREIIQKYKLAKGRTLLYVGSFSRWHACEAMIQAAAQMIKKDKKVKLLMIGHGQQYNNSIRLAEKLGVSENIIFIGKIPMEQVPEYINAADICFALFDRRYPPFRKIGYFYSPIKIH